MSVKDCLVNRPREASGAMAANRFDFQRDWALCHLFELQEGGKDYVLVMEHHDDVVVLDSPVDPKAVDCYQIKTADSHWSLTALLRPKKLKKAKGKSILGKMYENCLVFKASVRSVNLVSNYPYRMDLKCGTKSDTKDTICLNELADEEADGVIDKIMNEHGLTAPPVFLDLAKLVVTALSVHDHADHAKGKLVAFLERERPGISIAVGPLYNTLYDELRRKANYEKQGLDYDGVLKHKAISRAQFTGLISKLREEKKFEREWPAIDAKLASEDVGFRELIQIRDACRLFEMERMQDWNVVLAQTRQAVQAAADDACAAKLSATLDHCVARVRALRIKGSEIYGNPYLKAIALFHLYAY
ncbi:DUF4297 domain-containing protein [Planctomyces sp. SH-PL62]|uniref:DUF4297 domain-containing protein n=1 Tax=Planctomyces sp. SH-PL62 TaxID=1636152 RepID=UPI00078E631F|nr:DUF4297 domain-containing protein [Planctomyces sp. SH-PL62]AMV35862.1 hypothetical protein VT85_00360 [Planctomyces sp. SH-PL62]